MRIFLPAIAALGLLAPTVSPIRADPANGQRLAERWCASCHIVSSTQRQGTPDVPTFSAIARIPDFNVGQLVYYLLEPHPRMPDMALSRREASDLAEYIVTQGQ